MRWCSSVLLLAPVLALADPSGAQVLDLDGTAPGPPALGLGTYAADLVRKLEQEMTDLAAGTEGGEAVAGAVALGKIKFRNVAARLLDQGDRSGPAGSTMVLAGMRLARGRADLDELLDRLSSSPEGLQPARAALGRFNSATVVWSTEPDPEDSEGLDTALAAHLAPLAEAVRLLAPGETVNHWLTNGEVRARAGETDTATLQEMLGVLVAMASTTELPDDGRDALQRTTRFLQRGSDFQEFRPRIRDYTRLLTEVLGLAADVDRAVWLDLDQRSRCRAIITAAIVRLSARETRDDGARRLRRLADSRDVVRHISVLYDVAREAAPGRSRSRTPALDMEPVTRAFGAIVTAAGEPAPGDRPQVDRLEGILDRMIAYRELETPALTRDLRHSWRKLHDGYRRTERAIVEALPRLTTSPDALADPALASLVSDHRQYLDDLQRLEALPRWLETIRQTAPRAAGPFGGRVRRIISDLGDQARRQQAIEALDDLDRRMRSYFPMPFEARLIDGDRAAIIATGGLTGQLAAEIDRQRRDWAGAWGAGNERDIQQRLDMLRQLTLIMATSAPLLERGLDADLLNRWAAWELDAMTIARLVGDLGSRLKLASTAAIEGDDSSLGEQLDRIRAPEAALLSALLETLQAPISTLPSGPLSIMGQSISPPTPDAWMLGHRRELADLCRYTMELEYARTTGRGQLAEALSTWVAGLAGTLLNEISQ